MPKKKRSERKERTKYDPRGLELERKAKAHRERPKDEKRNASQHDPKKH
jgi:hypothetical protein